jgi:hypothetical protein
LNAREIDIPGSAVQPAGLDAAEIAKGDRDRPGALDPWMLIGGLLWAR